MGKGPKMGKKWTDNSKKDIKMVSKHMKRCSTSKYRKQSKYPYTGNGWIKCGYIHTMKDNVAINIFLKNEEELYNQ